MNGAQINPPDWRDEYRQAKLGLERAEARALDDPALFNALILRDERTGGPITLAKVHKKWHDLLSDSGRALIWSHVEAGKTTQLTVGRTLYELGRDHNLRVAIVSNTHAQAEKVVRTIARYIERSEPLRKATGLKPADPWTSTQLFVNRPVLSKDPSVQACGVHGNIVGSRIDLLILDDVLDFENCRTDRARQDLWDWVLSSLMGRLTANGRVVVVGTAYHPDDMMHRLGRAPGWTARRYPVLTDDGTPHWPERWPLSRVEKARQDMGPLEFARQMLCQARDDSASRFKREWLSSCLAQGDGREMAHALQLLPAGCKVVTGVDLAVQLKDSADLTVFFTIIVHPKEKGELREILNIESGRWSGPDIVQRVLDHHRRYHSIAGPNGVILVENNAAQQFIVQFAQGQGVPVRPFTTGRNKAHPEFGVESLAAEMARGQWVIPNRGGKMHPEVEAWVNEMLYYSPSEHTGDRLMASWFAREGVRVSAQRAELGFSLDLMRR